MNLRFCMMTIEWNERNVVQERK